ncbi:uncharacterized protein LOC135210469 [Macrobrachium nipponense]|uniref:uncharacterized protein LOC135210469 n=1 Tax=Macrobrachium nipponense TaxID=159736 RepID=UPI0030C7FD08
MLSKNHRRLRTVILLRHSQDPQTGKPMYKVAKKLNEIKTPYIPPTFSLKSSTEFIDLLHGTTPDEDIVSLDVESSFTSVPVDEIIQIMMDKIYRSEKPPLPIPEKILKEMLEPCAKEVPLFSHKGKIYRQKDGVVISSHLGVLFVNAYMAHTEEVTFEEHPKSKIYGRYIDDIFITLKGKNDR